MGRRSRSRSSSSNSSNSSSKSGSSHDSRKTPPSDGIRVHVGNLSVDTSKRELEDSFGRYGRLLEVWIARTPPCFAFISFKNRQDAEDSVRAMNGQ